MRTQEMEKMNLVKHHVSYKPPIVKLIPHQQHQEIHGKVPIITNLSLKMREYDRVTKACVSFKNYSFSFRREFNQDLPNTGIIIKGFEDQKRQILKSIRPMIKNKLKRVKHIKGLGLRLLAGLLAYADPIRFPSLRKFLHYCGYKKSSKKTKRYNRKVSSVVYQIAISLVMQKDEKYYPLYLKLKRDLEERFPNYRKSKIDGMAKKRIGTFLLKEIYNIFGPRNLEGTTIEINSYLKGRSSIAFNPQTRMPTNIMDEVKNKL